MMKLAEGMKYLWLLTACAGNWLRDQTVTRRLLFELVGMILLDRSNKFMIGFT